MRGRDVAGALIGGVITVAGCAGSGAARGGPHCQFERKPGMCEVDTLVDPRDSESADEATTLIVKWSWIGPKVAGEVPPKVTEFHMTANDARWRASALEELGKSRCVIEEAIAPADCAGERHIVFVEADP
jgi:hypothetical protein